MVRQALVLVTVVVIFGVLLPWYKGLTMLQPLIVVAYALMALLFVAPAASEFWSSLENPAPGAVLRRLLAIVGYGWGISIAMLAAAMVTLNVVYRSPRLLIPPEPFLASALLLSLTASIALAVICALLARGFSPPIAKASVRIFFLLILLVLVFGSRFLPETWQVELADHTTRRAITTLAWRGSIACGVISVVGLILLLRGGHSRVDAATA